MGRFCTRSRSKESPEKIPVKINQIKFKECIQKYKIKIEHICLGCLKTDTNLHNHPIFKGGICTICKESLKNAVTANEIEPKFCLICGLEKKFFVFCCREECRGVFCKTCFGKFNPNNSWTDIFKTKKWLCFLCTNSEDTDLIKEENWEANICSMFNTNIAKVLITKTSQPIRVLSLFDGIGAGFVALQKLGITVGEYWASEIDEDAIRVSSVNSHGKISHIGDICALTREALVKLGPVDLLLGGSPCTELSLVNPARTGLFNIKTTGILFFEYIRILKLLQSLYPEKTILYFFENTAAMPNVYRKTISRFFKSEPVLLDAKLFSPMKRARFFWGNVPGMADIPFGAKPADMRLGTFLTLNCNRTPYVNNIRTITTNSNSLHQGPYNILPVIMNGKEDSLWITETEKIFGFPEHYTDIGNLTTSKRLALIGSSWSVPVVRHLLRKLTNYFEVGTSDL